MSNTRGVGTVYEDMAVEFLEMNGHIIKERNFRSKYSEIDIVSIEPQKNNRFGISEYIVFSEVKYRKNSIHGEPYEAVSTNKQKKIITGARYYLYINKYSIDYPVRFDVISISENGIEWIKNAFSC